MKKNKVKKWFLAIGIALIFTMFINYGIATFFDRPDYEDFCKIDEPRKIYEAEADCVENNGQWSEYVRSPVPDTKGFCDQDFKCRQQYDEARDNFESKAVIVTVIAGVTGLILGIVLTLESVSAGFLLGGILNLLVATIRYWDKFANIARFLLLGLVLAVLIWVAYKKTK